LAGGTGLYFRALLQGLSPMPEADPVMREALSAEAAERGRVVADIVGRVAKRRVLAGGTGLYFRALLQGLSPMPEADPVMREALSA
ncbi:hypothetical protein C7E25_23430, partial [Stenotrophomonas maltophilia]